MSQGIVMLVVLVSPLAMLGLVMFMAFVERRLVLGLTSDELRALLVGASSPDAVERFVSTNLQNVLGRNG